MQCEQTTIFEFIPPSDNYSIEDFSSEVPIMPEEYKGKVNKPCGYTESAPREWTEQEVEWLQNLRSQGYSKKDIAKSIDRTEVAVGIKLKRLQKTERTYNQEHIDDKYNTNDEFLAYIKPKTVLDVYAGRKSFYADRCKVVSNDKNEEAETNYHLDALKFCCQQYCEGARYDVVDLDPFGSAYDCFDLAIKMATKGLIITFGELGHKRFKRLDYVNRFYGIETLDDFTIDNLIKEVEQIALRNKKELVVFAKKEWRNIGRVYFEIRPVKITQQWN